MIATLIPAGHQSSLHLKKKKKPVARTGPQKPYTGNETVVVSRDSYVSLVVIHENLMYLSKLGGK